MYLLIFFCLCSLPPVLVKQEHRDELDPSAGPPMPLPLAHAGSGLVRTQMPSPEPGHPQDGLLSSSPRGLAPGLHPLQPPCGPMGSPTFQHLPHLQGHGLHAGPPECQMAFHAGPHQHPSRSPYQPIMQHGHGLPFNGQPSHPMSAAAAVAGSGSPQGYERMSYQTDPAVAAACHSNALGLGLVYHSSSSSPNSGPPASSPVAAAVAQPMAHSSPHLHSLGYHCPNPGQVSSPTHSMGQQAPQMQRPMGYHPAGQRSASCPTPSSAPQQQRVVHSPHSGPSSPQLHSMPYQSPNSPSPTSGSPLGPLSHSSQPSPQASSPVMNNLSPAAPMVHPLAPQATFPEEEERVNIKQEPEEREPTFRSIGLQDITLDDGESCNRPISFCTRFVASVFESTVLK